MNSNPTEDSPDKPVERSPSSEVDAIAFQLQRSRIERGLSIVELSKQTGISKTVLHGYERGRTKPGAREIRLLCAALQVSPNRLILGNDSFETSTPSFTSFYRKVRARPALANLYLTMMLPAVSAILDEEEVQSVLNLVMALTKARNPEFADEVLSIAHKTLEVLDAATLPDGASLISPEAMQKLISDIQSEVMNSLDLLKK